MNDLISREEAINGFYEMASDIDHLCTVGDYISFLESLSAQPELVNDSPELNKLFGELKEKYEWAKRQEWIFNPLGYALYYVWKEYDERGELL